MKFNYTVTVVTVIVLLFVYFTVNRKRITDQKLPNNIAGALYHANLQHLIGNLVSFLFLSAIETLVGSAWFFLFLVFIWLVSACLLTLLQMLIPKFNRISIGFSGVVIGLAVIYASLLGKNKWVGWGGLLLSILPQFFMTGISVEGHLCGAFAGLLCFFIFRPDKIANARQKRALTSGSNLTTIKDDATGRWWAAV